jgi:hypothetical protein
MTPSTPVARSALAHPRWVARTIAFIAFAALCIHSISRSATASTGPRDARPAPRASTGGR